MQNTTRRSALFTTLWLTALVLLGSTSFAVAQDAAPVNLRPQFVTGRTTRYELWTLRKQEVIMSLGSRSQTASNLMEVGGEITWTVNTVHDDGGADCTMTLDWMTVKLIGNDGSQQANDSRQGSGDTEKVHQLIRAMCGAPLSITVANDGTITGVDGVDAIRSAAGDGVKVPEDTDFLETASDLVTVSQSPAELAIGGSFDAHFQWTHDMGTMRHDGAFTLADVENIANIPVATINGRFELDLEPDMSKLKLPDDAPAVDINFNGGKVNSQIMFDLQRGEAVGRNSVQTSSITMTMGVRNETLTRTINEMVQSQAIRISED